MILNTLETVCDSDFQRMRLIVWFTRTVNLNWFYVRSEFIKNACYCISIGGIIVIRLFMRVKNNNVLKVTNGVEITSEYLTDSILRTILLIMKTKTNVQTIYV